MFASLLRRSSRIALRPQRFCGAQNLRSQSYTKGKGHTGEKLQALEGKQASRRSWGAIVTPIAILCFAGAGIYIRQNDERRAILKGSEQGTISEKRNVTGPVIGGPFKLYDSENNLVTESSFRGKWILMYFGYTSSPDVGPSEVQKLADVLKTLESKYQFTITPVYVTIDPQRDTPAQLKAYLREFDPRIVGLTGPFPAIRQVAHEYRVFFRKVDEEGQDYLVESSNIMYLLDPNLEIRKCFGVEYDASQLADAILAEAKKQTKDK